MANDDLFNVDFNQLSEGSEKIDLSEAMVEPTKVPEGETVTLKEDVDTPLNKEETSYKETTSDVDKIPVESLLETPDTINIEGKSPGTGGDSSPITPFASLLQEKGFLPNLDIEDLKSAEDPYVALTEAWGKEVGLMQEQLIHSFPPEMIEMAKAVAQGIPFESLKDSKIKEINYGTITENQLQEDANLQKRLVSELLSTKGFNAKKIKDLVETYEDSGKLVTEANDALGEMKEIFKYQQEQVKQQYAQQQQQFQEQHAQRIKSIEESINSTEEIIPGMNLTEKSKKDLFANMTQIVGNDPQGQPIPYVMALRQEDPLKFDMAVTYLAQTTKGFTDWSKLTKTAKSNAAKQLADTLNGAPTRTVGAHKKIEGDASKDLMESINSMFK
jgi:hypothetical protein